MARNFGFNIASASAENRGRLGRVSEQKAEEQAAERLEAHYRAIVEGYEAKQAA